MADVQNDRRRNGLKVGVALVILLSVGFAAAFGLLDRSSAQQTRPATGLPPAVPVLATRAIRQDVPEYLFGLGSVQAFNSVQVRSRVDGTLMQVPVTEGQDVQQGDVLAVI